MQSLDLCNEKNIIYNQINLLKPREPFYVRVNSLRDLSDDIVRLINKACFISSEVFLSVPAEEVLDDELRSQYLGLGIKGFAIRVTHQVDKWLKHQGFGQFNSGDKDIVNLYEKLKRILPIDKELAVEFQVGLDTRILAPTITGLYELGARCIVLNVEGAPTRDRCVQFRDVFEYLKIRSCNRLNVYFPFWGPYFREWDIKTQNTFSGLEFVHIDISNRCTHSCVFCGLYGADAIEDMKNRSGGSLPETLKNHMKMEIDAEKCLSIIESLPWSVRQIQFGGFGDPLMHESAVKFIAVARSRGFRVEVLSNMEYLEDADIHQLHRLGGAIWNDLHFICNISGGTYETYFKTRPKQTEKSFNKIVHNISLFSELRTKNKDNGVNFTVMCVVNKFNCHDLLDVAKLAHKIGAKRLWFKPMEIHLDLHKNFLPQEEMMKAMAKSLKDAMTFAESNNVEIFQRDYCEQIIQQYSGETVYV